MTTERTWPGGGAVPPVPPVPGGASAAAPAHGTAAHAAGTQGATVTPPPPSPPGTLVPPVPAGRQIVTVRRARVSLTRIDPWSVMKLAFVLSLALTVVMVVAAAILWWVLSSSGVFDQLNTTLVTVTGTASLRIQDVVSLGRVVGVGSVLGLIDTVLITALATLAAFLFNLSTGLVGGVDVVLTETD